jgi:general secretion pathway protein N
MRDLVFRQPLTIALACLAIVLAAVIGFEFWSAGSRTGLAGGPVKAASVDAKLLPGLTESPAEQAYPETGTRPLFVPTRRPAPPAAAVNAMSKGQYVLQGVTIVGDLRVALLKDKSAGRMYRIEKGGDLNGTKVSSIEPDRVTLQLGDDTEVLELTVQKAGAAPAASAAAPPQPGLGPFGAPGVAAAAAERAAAAAATTGGGALPPGMPPVGTGGPAPMMPRPGAVPMQPMPPPAGAAPSPAPPMAGEVATPEDLLARRRAARRAQQQAQ